MVSKGVESVRSKVANLRDYSYTIDHQFFCEAVLEQFANEYNDGREIQPTIIDDASARDLPLRAVQVRDELRTWDWIYGQTPEFENKIEHEFMWGRVTARIKAEQGIITDVTLTTTRPEAATAVTVMAVALKGCKYDHGSVDEVIVKIRAEMPALLDREGGTISDVIAWLKEVVGM
ncbi:hypothetical protein BC937DRAFT_88290 [Endogone sp. FLAS-F59071]|nr:hypothetical protein BC937DRAFT_88290 [Endogone sp. FLAS-F59071]|eukprot:RUS18842.1 hypothetical protein BC937DRAFT_88290 [Endogone sp. FLAS-F59071]